MRLASNALLTAAGLGLAIALIAFVGPIAARATTQPHPGRDAVDRQKGGVVRISPREALAELERLEPVDAASITKACEIVAAGMVHYWPAPTQRDHAIECRFLEHPDLWIRMKWLDWRGGDESMLTGLRRLERADWRTALLVGVGYCSQQATVLARYLREQGVDACAMGLGGHVVTVAAIPQGQWVLDPDYGVVLPHSLRELEEKPELVRGYYEAIGTPQEMLDKLVSIYGPEGNSEYFGGEVEISRIERRPMRIRQLAFWGGLAALAGGLWLRRLARKTQQAPGEAALHHDAA